MATLAVAPTWTVDTDLALSWGEPRIVARYLRDRGRSLHEAERCFLALKQFLVVCAMTDEPRSPTTDVDEMWHVAMLFSRPYAEFCERVLGRFIHHEPLTDVAERRVYAATRRDAARIFGRLDTAYWPAGAEAHLCGSRYEP
jgi:hypothetical protein